MRTFLFKYFLLILCCTFQQLYAGDDPPDWVKNGYKAKYNNSVYIQALGQSSTEKSKKDEAFLRAEANARNQIAQQLQIRIASQSFTLKFEDRSGDIFQDQSSEKLLETTNITLSGLRIDGKYFDKKNKTCYALAVLDKRIASKAMYNEILALKNGANKSFESAKDLLNNYNPFKAIFSVRRSFSLLQAAAEREHILTILKTPVVELEAIPLYPTKEQILQFLNQIGETIQIEVNKTSNIIKSRAELPYRIQVTMFCENHPLNNASLSCLFRKGKGKIEINGRTDRSGNVTLLIKDLYSASNGDYIIEVLPDLSDLLFLSDQSDLQTWNTALKQVFRPVIFSFKRLDLDIDDYCAGVTENLVNKLQENFKVFRLALGNITFTESGVSSEFISYLKNKISNELTFYPVIKLISPEKIGQSLLNAKENYRGIKRPDMPEILAELTDSDGILVGNYWDRFDALEFNLQIIQRSSATVLSSAHLKLPKSFIPTGMAYVPSNLNTFSQVNQLGNLEDQESKYNVDVWVDRGDGAIYHAGEKLNVFVRSSQDCYLYLIYHDADGNDILIFPNSRQSNNRILGNIIYQIPDARDTFDFVVQPPFGSELLKAVVSSEPLPELKGRILSNGLKLLSGSFKENLMKLRGITTKDRHKNYAEGSCVITTVK